MLDVQVEYNLHCSTPFLLGVRVQTRVSPYRAQLRFLPPLLSGFRGRAEIPRRRYSYQRRCKNFLNLIWRLGL
jgi:hypothetical protein